MIQKMPALFIGHGSPMNAILNNSYTRSLKSLALETPMPKAILVISAHWLTHGTFVCNAETPRQIYDFYGFPEELHQIIYHPPGAKFLANSIVKTLNSPNIEATTNWGLDHASWAVLVHMYPDASIPVFEMSLNTELNEADHYQLGKKLAFLRDSGVLIIGSGDLVHNLKTMTYNADDPAFDWACNFDNQFKEALRSGNHERLIHARTEIPSYHLALPTDEHYLPALYIAALQGKDESPVFFHEEIQHGSISMTCFKITH